MGTRSRVATMPLVGGRTVLDLVNTVTWRGDPDRSVDHLIAPGDCLTWLVRTAVLTVDEADTLGEQISADPVRGAELVGDLVHARSVVDRVVTTSAGALDVAQHLIVDAMGQAELVAAGAPEPLGHRWVVRTLDVHTPGRRLALDLHDLLTHPPGRIGQCADDACRWVFLDTSPGHRRRWCDSQDCGNRFRVRRHQQRASGTGTPPRRRPPGD